MFFQSSALKKPCHFPSDTVSLSLSLIQINLSIVSELVLSLYYLPVLLRFIFKRVVVLTTTQLKHKPAQCAHRPNIDWTGHGNRSTLNQRFSIEPKKNIVDVSRWVVDTLIENPR